jgi:hypothetical protein
MQNHITGGFIFGATLRVAGGGEKKQNSGEKMENFHSGHKYECATSDAPKEKEFGSHLQCAPLRRLIFPFDDFHRIIGEKIARIAIY